MFQWCYRGTEDFRYQISLVSPLEEEHIGTLCRSENSLYKYFCIIVCQVGRWTQYRKQELPAKIESLSPLTIIDKRLGTIGHLLLQGHSRRPK